MSILKFRVPFLKQIFRQRETLNPETFNKNSQQQEELISYLSKIQPNTMQDRIFGCVFGQIIGDSLGAYLEFKNPILDTDIDKALGMPGGGIFKIAPGQITDDSEMALCAMRGFNEMKDGFDLECIAKNYYQWFLSGPFDIGITTNNALNYQYIENDFNHYELQQSQAHTYNKQSLSNGGLMRSSSFGIYAAIHKLDFNQLKDFVTQEVRLTHSNLDAVDAQVLWAYSLQQFLLGKKLQLDQIIIKEYYQRLVEKMWMQVQQNNLPDFQKNIGFLAIPWISGFCFLNDSKIIKFNHLMKEVLRRGGDTDTNACIIGSIYGAAKGFIHIQNDNPDWIAKVIKCQPLNNREYYKPIDLILETQKLYENFKIQSRI